VAFLSLGLPVRLCWIRRKALVNYRKLCDKPFLMPEQMQGSIRLFRIVGITVFLHWSWFLVAMYEIRSGSERYSSIIWNVLEYLALFLIVLLHEFGHALACRRVGGQAEQIVLWPLGGIAYVSPPQRPGAMLWSIAAGPLVNVALFPVLTIIMLATGWSGSLLNLADLFSQLWWINIIILGFNLLPIYPLDGGQIVRSLLWFKFGRTQSLMIAAILGFIGMGGMLFLAFLAQSLWFGILAVFILLNCWKALTYARSWARVAKAPRRDGYACPNCKKLPPRGAFWICSNCQNPFDPFGTDASCPHCRATYSTTSCPECDTSAPISAWSEPANAQFPIPTPIFK
jgi:Zn-dependent protease